MVTSIACAVAVLVMVILPPLINALEESLTVPTILPVATVVCAKRGESVSAAIARTKPKATIVVAFNMSTVSGKPHRTNQLCTPGLQNPK